MKRVVNSDMVAHLWANQSQDEARNGKGSYFFDGTTIYSYRRDWPIATLLLDKGCVVFNTDNYGVTTAHHLSMARGAVHGLRAIDADRRALIAGNREGDWSGVIACRLAVLKETARGLARPGTRAWEVHSRGLPDDEQGRVSFLRSSFDEIAREAEMLVEPLPLFPIEELVQNIRDAYDRWNNPKRVAARARNAELAPFNRFKRALDKVRATQRGRGIPFLRYSDEREMKELLKVAPRETDTMRLYQIKLALEEQQAAFEAANPYARDVLHDRRAPFPSTRVTPDEWREGKGNAVQYFENRREYTDTGHRYMGFPTLLRRKGDRLETSRGAIVSWDEASRAWRVLRSPRVQKALGMKIGGFTVMGMDAEAVRVGCHELPFNEMTRLALREGLQAPPRFPPPAPLTIAAALRLGA